MSEGPIGLVCLPFYRMDSIASADAGQEKSSPRQTQC